MIKLKKVLIYLGMFLLFLELASRFYLFGFDVFNYFKVNSFNHVGVSGLIRPAAHREMVYEWKPNLDTYFKMTRFKTNSQGLRDKEYSIKKPANTFRVAVLGPSSTVPAGVNIEDAYHSLLEERLNKESLNTRYEFINFSVGGYGTRQCLATLKHKVIPYGPDLVLFNFPESGRGEWPQEVFERPYNVRPRGYPFFESFFWKLINNAGAGSLLNKKMKNNPEEREKGWDKDSLDAVFSEFSKIKEVERFPIYVLFLDKTLKIAKELALKYGFLFMDMERIFDYQAFGGRYCSSPLDCHPNAAAHKIFADIIYESLQKAGLLEKSKVFK